MRVFKYVLNANNVNNEQTILMHPGDIIHVGTQKNSVCVWALVDTDLPPAPRKFALVMTGYECTYDAKQYIGTVQLLDGYLIFHVFLI
jgi:hypothetical protein